ncbi:isochorismate synthase [Vibrio sp. FNV 38]|nr:isochorismate synthase [Vibrio sp. FNV 38]
MAKAFESDKDTKLDFSTAITTLIERIDTCSTGQVRFVQSIEKCGYLKQDTLIDWLEAQPLFPKFYWQDREGTEQVAALGQMYTFHHPAPAYTILGEQQRVWGGRAFSPSSKGKGCLSSFFFLPIIELVENDGAWHFVVNTNRSKSDAIAALNELSFDYSVLGRVATQITQTKHSPEKKQWCDLVDHALSDIAADKFKKVVLARKTTVELSRKVSAAQITKSSRDSNHNSFHFLFAMDAGHSFIGSTPERLYRRIGRVLNTEALAGTTGRGHSFDEDSALAQWLSNDKKNINENQYVVDDILERLELLAEHIQVDDQATLIRLRQVQHLKRSIYAQLNEGVKGVELLEALQPTAAVAGLPRHSSLAFIEENEPFIRGWYAGSVGYLGHEKAEFCVAIRSALVVDDVIHLFAGAGIVPGSKAEHEWQELDKKLLTLLSLLGEENTENLGVYQ